MKGKKKRETEYRNTDISKTRRQSVLKLTDEERALVPSYPFTESDLACIKKKARKEARGSLYVPMGVVLLVLGIAILCVLQIALIPHAIECQNWMLQQNRNSIFSDAFLLCIPLLVPLVGLVAYGFLWIIVLGAAWMIFHYVNIHRPGGQFHRMKKEVQEDLKTELAANRLFAERKARVAADGHDTSCMFD